MADMIWIVRDPSGHVIGAGMRPVSAVCEMEQADRHNPAFLSLFGALERSYPNWSDRHEHNGYTLTREPLPTPARAEGAGEVIPQHVRNEWKRERGRGMTSAVGEYTPAEFWTLLDAYEELLAARTTEGATDE